jgi:hypothetical protein
MRPAPEFRFNGPLGVKQRLIQRRLLGAAFLVGLGFLSACAYRGGIELPFTQKVAWFSYLNGDDIRAACVAGAPRHYRLVYNGEYDRQIRTYEILADGGGAAFTARVQGGGGIGLLRLSFSDPGSLGGWTTAQARLEASDLADLERALEKDAAYAPPPPGMNLASEEFYWIFVGCRDGKVAFNAWRYGDDRFAALTFPSVLLRHDATGVAVNPPRDVGPIDRVKRGGEPENTTPRFDLAIGANGLLGLAPRI